MATQAPSQAGLILADLARSLDPKLAELMCDRKACSPPFPPDRPADLFKAHPRH